MTLHSRLYYSTLVFLSTNVYKSCVSTSGKNIQYRRLDREDSLAEKTADQEEPTFNVALWSIAKLGIVLAYFYIADRTNYLLKENKQVFL